MPARSGMPYPYNNVRSDTRAAFTGQANARAHSNLENVPADVLKATMQDHLIAVAEGRVQPSVIHRNPRLEKQVGGYDLEPDDEPQRPLMSPIGLGCIGGIALDVMAPQKARSLAIIGTGEQARAHLDSAVRTRRFADIRIYGPRPVAATEIAKAYAKKLGFGLTVSSTPEAAVHNAQVIILATNSPEPVIDADWVAPHAHITTVGPHSRARYELPLGLIQRCRTIATDDLEAVRENADHLLAGNPALKRMVQIGDLIGKFNPDRGRGMTLFMAEGVFDGDEVLERAARKYADRG